MQIKTFEADNMTEALKAAKDAFGPDAVILGVKTGKSGSRLLGKWKKQKVSLTAATDTSYPDYDTVSISEKRPVSFTASSAVSPAREEKSSRPILGDERASIQMFSNPSAGSSAKDMLPASYVKKLFWVQQQMVIAGVDEESVQELMMCVHKNAVKRTYVSDEILMEILEAVIQDRIRLKPTSVKDQGLPKCMVFVGPTGVGKTTTIAKIATIFRHHHKSSLGLITLDDQRIGGISQLAIYARILGVSIKAASSVATLRKALMTLADKQLILVDTAGINPNDFQQLDRLKKYLVEINTPHIHLVMSTTTKERDLKAISDAFQPLPIRNLIFTKIDESTAQGNILNRTLQTGIPLSYFTDGRNVPDDIHVMTAKRLMVMIFNTNNLRQAKSASPETLADRLQTFEKNLMKQPLKSKPYRTYSTQWGQKNRSDPKRGYAQMAELTGSH